MAVKTEPISLRWAQGQIYSSEKRFRVLVAGRRFGKSYLSCVELVRGAIEEAGRNLLLLRSDLPDGKRYCVESVKKASSEGLDPQ